MFTFTDLFSILEIVRWFTKKAQFVRVPPPLDLCWAGPVPGSKPNPILIFVSLSATYDLVKVYPLVDKNL